MVICVKVLLLPKRSTLFDAVNINSAFFSFVFVVLIYNYMSRPDTLIVCSNGSHVSNGFPGCKRQEPIVLTFHVCWDAFRLFYMCGCVAGNVERRRGKNSSFCTGPGENTISIPALRHRSVAVILYLLVANLACTEQ